MKALLTSQLKTGSRFHSSCRLVSSTTSNRDHYSTLGVSRTADAKEIKSAFYELSKKYHPDRNPDDKAGSSIKFQDIVNAYEVLSNASKRKEYDAAFMPRRHTGPQPTERRETMRQKNYTDLDIDFRDLEHFQRMARRRTSSYKYETSDDFLKNAGRYRSNQAVEREREERKLREELEREKLRSRYRTPTFEELIQQERRRTAKQASKNMRTFALMSCIFIILASLYAGRVPR